MTFHKKTVVYYYKSKSERDTNKFVQNIIFKHILNQRIVSIQCTNNVVRDLESVMATVHTFHCEICSIIFIKSQPLITASLNGILTSFYMGNR